MMAAGDPFQPFAWINNSTNFMTRFLATLLVLGTLSGVSLADVYSDAYDELMDYDEAATGVGHTGFWWPQGAEFSYERRELTAEEQSNLKLSLETCVADLREGNETPPTSKKSVAAVLLVQCMQDKGWSLRFMAIVSPDHFHNK